jgi:hypothetical protein
MEELDRGRNTDIWLGMSRGNDMERCSGCSVQDPEGRVRNDDKFIWEVINDKYVVEKF